MSTANVVQLVALAAAVLVTTPLLGRYLAAVFGPGAAPGERFFGPVERGIHRLCGIDPEREQGWSAYASSVLAFSAVSVLGLYGLQRVQGLLPLNPADHGGVAPGTAFNTAVSFVTNTNWQSYAGESTMSQLTQMAGLTVQNFVSAGVGLAVAVALIRGLVRQRSATIGSFWVDLVRGVLRVLLPMAVVGALVFASQGVVQDLRADRPVTTVEGRSSVIPGGPVASQESIKELGTNGGGYFNANSAHPFESPNGATTWLQMWMLLSIPFALTYAFGRMAGDQRQGWVVFAAMAVLLVGSVVLATHFEVDGNPRLTAAGASQTASSSQAGGNMEGKEVRFGPALSAGYAAATTGTSNGAVVASHDSFTPGGGGVPLANMMLGEVSPGGVGAGLYGMLVFALLAVFIAGLMVGRTPEYLGKKVQAAEMKLVVLYILAVPIVVLGFSAASVLLGGPRSAATASGPHGLTQIVYAYTSAGNNNGSAFGGLGASTTWYDTTLGLAMLVGRFLLIVPVLAIAGSLGAKRRVPATTGTFPTGTPLFTGLVVGVVLIVVGLTYFPVLALGPIVEHLGL